jgi:hypothetical protein
LCLDVKRLFPGVDKFMILLKGLLIAVVYSGLQKKRQITGKGEGRSLSERMVRPKINFIQLNICFFKTMVSFRKK